MSRYFSLLGKCFQKAGLALGGYRSISVSFFMFSYLRVQIKSSVRVNDQYRIEFIEEIESDKKIATICNITDLSNHYK